MVDYNLETLGDEKFQKLCQALLTSSFPNVQCLPVGQPDGGRDAFSKHDGGFLAFQVKFAKNPASKTERDAIEELIKLEKPKVEILISKGATSYYLLTNVGGTSHLDVGSIDRINDMLTDSFGIPSYCWWRDDLERRIETTEGLIWRYPDIFRGSDFLEVLTSGKAILLSKTKANTFRSYVAAQYSKESEVRFQQVQIQNSLLDLFTDTPIGFAREKLPNADVSFVPERSSSLILRQHHRYHDLDDDTGILAADWLLSVAPTQGLQRIVLEGAPGQGKSTVTQYLAQIQRMRSLRKETEATKVQDTHLSHVVRLPFRVDLRDYSSWLTGNDPFATEKDVKRPLSGTDSLESFLCHQIYTLSGGREFKIDDFSATIDGSHCFLVLDGFDEVADKPTRVRLIEQIRVASERLGQGCQSIQVIVTSRPAAFILSPGFPEREWLHLSLSPMRMAQISEYTDKWINARNLSLSEGRDFKSLLIDRVSRPHIRSLAQNPMQLAILLTLISTKGRSLPDKRTALYDSYMDLFFGREAEKDETVRENRDVLIQIHQYVAWTLQLDAERPGGSGSITHTELEKLVRLFLIEKEHTGDVLKLFTGAVERVGALVSRVQGMLEFEVQPLREYFSGRFLYETAPYSPPGAEKGGTRPQRFDALARRPYWLNVARFYAGCYNSGELSSLVSGLEHLDEQASLSLRSHTLQLAVLLLNDWVFSQEPRTVRDVVSFIATGNNLRLLVASSLSWDEDRLSFPEKCGRKEVAESAKKAFFDNKDMDYRRRLGLLIQINSSMDERVSVWRQIRDDGQSGLMEASYLGLFSSPTDKLQNEFIEIYGDSALQALTRFGRLDNVSPNQRIAALKAYAVSAPLWEVSRRYGLVSKSNEHLYKIYVMLDPYVYSFISYEPTSEDALEDVFIKYGIYFRSKRGASEATQESGLFDVSSAADRAIRFSALQWRTTLEPWSDFIESVRRTWGDSPRVYALAATAAGIKSKEVRASAFVDLFDEDSPLAERARHARLRTAIAWWKNNLNRIESSHESLWVMTLLFVWAPSSVFKALNVQICAAVDGLDPDHWRDLLATVRSAVASTRDGRASLSGLDEKAILAIKSSRVLALLTTRISRALSVKVWPVLMEKFDGSDPVLGNFISLRSIEEAYREPKLWKNVLGFFRRFTGEGGESAFGGQSEYELNHRVYYGGMEPMPVSIAAEIAEDNSALPLRFLEMAERTVSRRSGVQTASLGSVAETESWFSD